MNEACPNEPAASRGPSAVSRAETWLGHQLIPLVLVIVGVAFVLRLLAAIPGYFNPDELLHVFIAGGTSLADIFRGIATLSSPHPPLFEFVLYPLNLLGGTEFVLRLPSVLAGTALVWLGFLWLRDTVGDAAALAGTIVLAFAPRMVQMSAEVREYALTILLILAGLHLLERAWRQGSILSLLLSALMMMLAVSTLYAAIWVALAMAGYGLLRVLRERPRRAFTLAWLAGQAAFGLLTLFYYLAHIRLLFGWKQRTATEGWLTSSYFQTGQDSPLLFPLRQTVAAFQYLFASPVAGVVMLVAFAVGVALLCTGARRRQVDGTAIRFPPRKTVAVPMSRKLALLLVLPFAIGAAVAFSHLYPYGGTRHCLHLIVFAAAGVGVALAWLFRHRLLPVLAASLVLVPLWSIFSSPAKQHITPRDQRRGLMREMVNYIRETVPEDGIVFCDFQTQVLLRYYLCGSRTLDSVSRTVRLRELAGQGCRLVYPDQWWTIEAGRFGEAFRGMVEALNLTPGDTVCIADAGWGWNLADELAAVYKTTYPGTRRFGRQLSVFLVPVRSEPGSLRVGRLLDSLARTLPGRVGHVLSTFWPTDQFDGPARSSARFLPGQALSYGELYGKATPHDGSFEQTLPALAFWVFGNHEFHLEPLDQMAGARDFQSGWYSFRLLAADPDTVVGVYLIESLKVKALKFLARAMAARSMSYVQAVLWPTDYFTDSVPGFLGGIGSLAMPYSRLYQDLKGESAGLKPYLPALAFWAFGTKEKHLEFMSLMDKGASYTAGGCKFTLFAVDPWQMAAVYQVDTAR